ncbi:alanine--tRNA ligase [Mesomycoplasma neurolyticum]|uniref:Alanine--tRNA ligase n=1 Tax=Mesomycoplasma neurolyticum TaxID=2120 RepID=A0A449A6A0_9BACT|nr:alanine--tRNA ligase [Mesomycoplasma neurolyticum]VEU59785.1 Alanine--tRNA ligase [Mesomycoplasma neurolyticum]
MFKNKKLSSKEIRQIWLDYFKSKDHLIVESKSLIPVDDPSLLWINSGVATLKDYFSGKKQPPSLRLTNSQKAIRTNDIENVGVTTRHHTMFEMLGNFSIGDYFKKEAIEYAYDFLINVLGFDLNKLYFTYFEEDDYTKQQWLNLNIDPSHIIKGTRKTNFWDLGSGPCGPCTEIFYDRGEKFDKRGIELLQNDIENDRFIEVWNIVFSQFNNDGENNYTELRQKNIDTGAGFERLVSIIQDVPTNFDTDLFLPIIREIEKMSEFEYVIDNYFKKEPFQTKINTYFKIIADHIRAVVNAINDGVTPSNVSRGYIIRRLIRRSYRAGLKLNIKSKTFLYKLTDIVKQTLPYDINVEKVSEIIKQEEKLFSQTIEQGQILLEQKISKDNFDLSIVFKLFETYGFPLELTQEILAEKDIHFDLKELDEYKKKHSEISKSSNKMAMKTVINSLATIQGKISEFIGYETYEIEAKILFLANKDHEIEMSNKDEISYLILDQTVLYATAGGQKHDQGSMWQDGNEICVFEIFKDKFANNVHVVKGKIDKNKPIKVFVDKKNRVNLERNHSSTHLLFKSLREQYGLYIKQLGSDNNEERLTFDFPSDRKPTKEEIKEIEERVQSYIKQEVDRKYLNTTTKEAEKMNAIMTLEEAEYMDQNNVRLVQFKDITVDLCGGTHIKNTKLIENFKIISVENKGTGVFRIRAITSNAKINEYLNSVILTELTNLQQIINKNLKIDSEYKLSLKKDEDKEKYLKNIIILIEKAREDYKLLLKKSSQNLVNIIPKFEIFNDINYFINFNLQLNQFKNIAVDLREKYHNSIFILGAHNKDKVLITVASKQHNANDILRKILTQFKGNGGGSTILAQGAIAYEENLETKVKEFLKK